MPIDRAELQAFNYSPLHFTGRSNIHCLLTQKYGVTDIILNAAVIVTQGSHKVTTGSRTVAATNSK